MPIAAERLQHLLGVAPDLRIEAGAPGVEHADHGPVALARSAASRRSPAPRNPSAIARPAMISDGAGPEHPALDDRHLRAQRRALRARRRGSRRSTGLPESRLGRLISTTGSFDTSSRAVRAGGDVGQRLDDRRLARGRCRSAPRSASPCGSRRRCPADPVATSVSRRPAASISTVANTYTTSAMPPAVSAVVSLRATGCARCRRRELRHGAACYADGPQAVDDAHARRAPRRERARRRRRRRARRATCSSDRLAATPEDREQRAHRAAERVARSGRSARCRAAPPSSAMRERLAEDQPRDEAGRTRAPSASRTRRSARARSSPSCWPSPP